MKNSDQPINALSEETTDRVDAGIKIYTGLTKREYAAIMAMQGMLGNSVRYGADFQTVSMKAVRAADCLLAELEKEQSK